MDESETALTGGRITPGVVRIGDTVRRPMLVEQADAQRLLQYLAGRGFDGAPRFLGIDEQHRQMLSFLPGEVPSDLGHFTDDQLLAAARLLRRYHDATVDFAPVRTAGAEVMCHNDWGPPNAVFRDGLPYAMIDFDTVAPGPRLWDIGYSASAWLDLGCEDYSGAEQIRRLDVFAAGYDHPGVTATTIAIHAVARQTALAVSGRVKGETELAEWASGVAEWTVRNVTERLAPTRMIPGE